MFPQTTYKLHMELVTITFLLKIQFLKIQSLPVLYEPEHRDGDVDDERVAVQANQLQEGQRRQLRRPPQESGEKLINFKIENCRNFTWYQSIVHYCDTNP